MIKVIISLVWATCSLVSILIVAGCDYRADKLISEQSTTFEDELAFRQRLQYVLENQISMQAVEIAELKEELECKQERE